MANGQLTALLRHIRQLMVPQQMRLQSDSQLLQAFCASQDEHAFAALVQSHGPMVWRVCHAVLRQTEEAEDAFQATFLVLARKASSIRKTESLPSWLHGVAYRIAVSAQRALMRRIAREATLQLRPTTDPASEVSWLEVQALLHEEVERLPEKYRAPFVLCFLEGHSRAETARRLGLKHGTVWSRLAKARQRLQGRLARRGISLSAVLTAAAIVDGEAPAAVVSRLAQSVIQAAVQYAAGKSLMGGMLSTKVLGLANGRMAGMFLTKVKITVAVVIASAGIMSAGLFAHRGFAGSSSDEKPVQEQKPAVQQASQLKIAEQNRATGADSNGDPLPAGALARLGADRFRRDAGDSGLVALSAQGRLAFSADGNSLYAAGNMDGMVHAWDVTTGKERQRLRVFENRQIRGSSMAISPEGNLVAAVANGNIAVWNAALARQIRQVMLPLKRPDTELVFLPDGKSVAFLGGATGNNEISFLELSTGKLHQLRLQLRPQAPLGPDLPPQVAGRRGRLGNPQANMMRLFDLNFSPDGKIIACKSMNGSVQFWDLTGAPLTNFPTDAQQYAFGPDGRTLAFGNRTGVSLWDLTAGKQLAVLSGMRNQAALAFSPDGKKVAVSSMMSVVLWDTATAKQMITIGGLGRSSDTTIRLLRFSPDSKTLAGAGGESVIRVWDVATGKERDAEVGHRGAVTDIVFAPDGMCLATTAHTDPYLRLWQAESGKALQVFTGGFRMHSPHFSADGRTLLVAGPSVFVWDTASGKEMQRLNFPKDPGDQRAMMQHIESIALSPDHASVTALRIYNARLSPRGRGQVPAADGDRSIVATWDPVTGKEVARREDSIELDSQWVLSPDGRLRASFQSGPFSKINEANSGKLVATLDAQCELLWTVAFSSDSKKLAGLCHQGYELPLTVVVWDLSTGKEIRRILTAMNEPGPFLPGYLAGALAFSPDGKILATGAQENGGIQLWDIATGKEIGRFQGYGATVTSLGFDPSGRRLVSGLANGTALIWNVAKAAEPPTPAKLPKPMEKVPAPPEKISLEAPKPLEGAGLLIRDLINEAQMTFVKVEAPLAKIIGLEECAVLLARKGDVASGQATLEKARKLFVELPESSQRQNGPALAKAYAEAGDLDGLRKVLDMLLVAERPIGTQQHRDLVVYQATTALAQAGKSTEAVELAKANKSPAFRIDHLLGDSAGHFALAGDLKRARTLLDLIADPYMKVQALAGSVHVDSWNYDLPNPPGGIALKLDQAGNRQAARQLLKQAEAFAVAIKDSKLKAQSLAAIACCEARVVDLDSARTTLEKIPADSKFRSLPLMAIARSLAATGHSEEARRVIEGLDGALLQAEGFSQLAGGQLTAGDRKGALVSCDKAWERAQTYRDAYTAAQSLMNVRIKAGDYQGAAFLSEGINRERAPFLFSAIATNQTEAGAFNAALETIEEHISQNDRLKCQALQNLAKVQSEHNQEKKLLTGPES